MFPAPGMKSDFVSGFIVYSTCLVYMAAVFHGSLYSVILPCSSAQSPIRYGKGRPYAPVQRLIRTV